MYSSFNKKKLNNIYGEVCGKDYKSGYTIGENKNV